MKRRNIVIDRQSRKEQDREENAARWQTQDDNSGQDKTGYQHKTWKAEQIGLFLSTLDINFIDKNE
jgi:hypothetical protein